MATVSLNGPSFSGSVSTFKLLTSKHCTMGTGALSKGQNSWGMALTTHSPTSNGVKERVELYFYFPFGPSRSLLR